MVTQAQLDAFEQRIAARLKREKAAEVEETPADLQSAYLKRTGRDTMTAAGTGKGPRLVENKQG